ncbi:DUF3263 domain-containing protein [Streptomyces nitrosporeus]|uniref:DUF3263 domain-containing protein n=1 Tax=Streptomyces nitrosporeus TaxID=28894 RepID=A0A5J6FA34_9ACTN|nr:DUF3263 domain-containing protein [Streptomyces nitrosporeus]QEU73121.1 DUF3263 domain-containing protein [Streptomyces nitrosporeus]GGZ10417.1 hypothetical protein GCM10010327_46420 [Streptomyces nitrosporeus]
MTEPAPDPGPPDPETPGPGTSAPGTPVPDTQGPGAPGAGTPGPEARETPAPAPASLTGPERSVLAMERRSWAGPGAKERAIREQLGISPVRYYQLLNALLDDRRALEEDPVTVNRLRRVRESRRGHR